jgi:hypothetical protein
MAERERSWRRSVADTVFGVEGRIASTVYGTVLVMATLAAASGEVGRPGYLAALVSSVVVAVWVAHLYAHGLSESIERRQRVTLGDLERIAHREVGILIAAAVPVVVLVLGAAHVLAERTAIWLALGAGLLALVVQGVRYARVEGLGLGGTAAAVGANLTLGLLVVGLKVVVFH